MKSTQRRNMKLGKFVHNRRSRSLMEIKQKISTKGILLTSLLIVALVSVPLNEISAQSAQINVESVAFDKTTIIEFENKSNKNVSEVRIWLPTDVEFKSFKSEEGWIGEKNSAGVIVFTTSSPMKPGEVVKFGIKTDIVKPKISWKTIDNNETTIELGTSEAKDLKNPEEKIDIQPTEENAEENKSAIYEMSSFRLIPDKPKVGDTVRVVGTSFAANEVLNFYIDNERIVAFETNEQGNFIITEEIPADVKPSRIDFTVKDSEGNEKVVSLRVSEENNRFMTAETVLLTMRGLPEVLHRGDTITITGTADPGSTVTAQILGPEGNIITAEPRPVDIEGNWSFESIISQDTPYGKYEAVITDGITSIDKTWKVESSKVIEIEPTTLKFEPGELLVFNGTAIPNESIEFILENPQGIEIFSDVKEVDSSGNTEFTFQTEQSDIEGTYVLIAKQRDSTEIILTGLGELPKEHIVAKLDKINYKKSEIATINIDGPASATLSLLVVDPSDREKFVDNEVKLQPDGKLAYSLDLEDYSSGVYSLILSRANTKTTELFSVGLQFGSGEIEISTTKITYEANDPILILGETNANVLLTMELFDPNGNLIKEKETFTNKDGRISEGSFRIPSDAIPGIWQIKATSGSNFEIVDLEVVATHQEGMIIVIEGIEELPTTEDLINFKVLGAQQNVEIEVTDANGEIIGETIEFPASKQGEIHGKWPIPKEQPPGTYTITATDAFDSATVQFILE